MKHFLLALFAILTASIQSHANPTTHRALCRINAQWSHRPTAWALAPTIPLLTDTDWIRHHLRLVEDALRKNSPASLSANQLSNRLQLLDVLHGYWQEGRFPQNETHAVRTPVFIDAYGTFCAVGYLLERSGAGALARSVSAQNNFVYLPELSSPELDAWAREHGFTRDELAWIQPSYQPSYFAVPVGGGTNGFVNELLVSGDGQKLYVGGQFTHVNGSLAAPNIAYVTESAGAYTWHSIGVGLEGPVSALVEWDGKLFAGGNGIISQGAVGSSLAFWNGTNWTMAGQTSGHVYDLEVFRDTLYAAGHFSTPGGPATFARWNGSQWISISGLSGTVRTMEVVGQQLFLGGSFVYASDTVSAIRWSSESSFIPFANRMVNEVRDFEVFKDTVYASCRFTSGIVHSPANIFYGSGTDTNLICRLAGDTWHSYRPTAGVYPIWPDDTTPQRTVSINTLLAAGDTLTSAGDLYIPVNGVGIIIRGVLPIVHSSSWSLSRWFTVDSAINKLVVFKQSVFAGGHMKRGAFPQPINGICRQVYSYQDASVQDDSHAATHTTLTIHPNPSKAGTELFVSGPFPAQQVRLLDAAGRVVWSTSAKRKTELHVPMPPAAGQYFVEWLDDENNRATGAVIVQ